MSNWFFDGAGDSRLDVRQAQFFTVLERAAKFAAVVASEFFGTRDHGVWKLGALVVIDAFLAGAVMWLRPVSVAAGNALRCALFAFAAWTSLVSALVVGFDMPRDAWLPLGLWAFGTASIVAGFVLHVHAMPPPGIVLELLFDYRRGGSAVPVLRSQEEEDVEAALEEMRRKDERKKARAAAARAAVAPNPGDAKVGVSFREADDDTSTSVNGGAGRKAGKARNGEARAPLLPKGSSPP